MDINNNKSVTIVLRAREEEVFDVVYRHYFRGSCAFRSQYAGEQEEIEEIAQETMAWLWENRCTPTEELTLKILLFTTVENKALNCPSHFKIKRKVYQEIVDKHDSELNNPDLYPSGELFRLHEEALEKLPKEHLEAYEANRDQRLAYKEVAEKLDVSPQVINYRIGQALELLRVVLKDYLPLLILIFGPNFLKQS